MNIFSEFDAELNKILCRLYGAGAAALLDDNPATQPRDAAHGDIASNAALVLAKHLRRAPRQIAGEIVAGLKTAPGIERAEVAGAGFVNVTLDMAARARILQALLAEQDEFARPETTSRERINVEYVSANPTGPLHVGHCRGAVFGDALANLLDFAGHQVTREYYVNDAGAQTDTLARSALLRYRQALGEEVGEFPAGLYPGSYLVAVGQQLAESHGANLRNLADAEQMRIAKETAIAAMLEMIRSDLARIDIRHDVFFRETELHGAGGPIDAVIEALWQRDLIYRGITSPPKGHVAEDWEAREQVLFRATRFGDDVDRALQKSDGSHTYFAADIAYLKSKLDRKFDVMVYVLGADHGGYVKRLQAIVAALTREVSPDEPAARLIVRLCQLVTCLRAGKPVTMSKRAGEFIKLSDLVDEVGADAVRFMMLTRKNDAPLDFDFETVCQQSKDNPVFYVQYAHARCCSVFRQAKDVLSAGAFDEDALARAAFTRLTDPQERLIVLRLAAWPRVVELATRHFEPHRIAFYLQELSALLHAHWNRGKELPQLRFINPDDEELTIARLGLVRAVMMVIRQGLGLLGVTAPAEMR